MKKINKKAFTLIEIVVVVAVIGILVLLAVPRFIGHSERTEITRVQHDVKVMEQKIGTIFINGDDDFNKWGNNRKDLNQLAQDNELFEKEGVADAVDPIDGNYKVIPGEYKDKINTKLKGTFYANSHGKVYYEHGEMPGYSDEEIQGLIAEGYIPIATPEDLNSIRSTDPRTYAAGTKWATENKVAGGLSERYVQVANIDLSGYSEEGWAPIGTDSASRFTGTYDGGNFVITDLEVKGAGNDYQGLFGYTNKATISNVALEDVNVTGRGHVGGLVGLANASNISNSYVTGSVKGSGNNIGGLVGYASFRSKISNSYATGTVTGNQYVGGLMGYADNKATISNSHAEGSVNGAGWFAGGLVGGARESTIEKSYTTGSVTGSLYVGGLAGYANKSNISNSYATGTGTGNQVGGLVGNAENESTIINSYATGDVTGSTVGGLVGSASSNSNISNSYWDKETTGQSTSAEQDESFGKTTDEMKKQTTYEGWDTNVWSIVNGDYPKLK